MEEKCDIVDPRDQVVAVKLCEDVLSDFVNTRYVNIVLVNPRGEIWTPWCRDDLKRWPGGPDFAVGGADMSGEDYIDAAMREAQEAIGLKLTPQQLEEIAYISPYQYPVSCFMKVYELITDEQPQALPSEYKSRQWFGLSDLLRLLGVNEMPTKPDLLLIMRLCYGPLKNLDRSLFRP